MEPTYWENDLCLIALNSWLMPCQHASQSSTDNRLDRRSFMKAAVAIGGVSAASAVSTRQQDAPPSGTGNRDALPDRQFAWDEHTPLNDIGLPKGPSHRVLLHLRYAGEGTPTEKERQQVEQAFRTLERAFEWSNEGLLFTVGYSLTYFDRFDAGLPDGTGLMGPETVIDRVDIEHSGEVTPETDDAHIHLASDDPQAVIEADAALRGEIDEVNGERMPQDLSVAFEVVDRRTGFVGAPLPHERFGEDVDRENPIDEDAPVMFGFKSLFRDSQPNEDHVAITGEGHPFADGTTEHVSILWDQINDWYEDHDHDERVERMYSPHHSSDSTGQHGRELGRRSGPKGDSMTEVAHEIDEDAREQAVVGHAQKMARARDPLPPLLRRDFPSTDGGHPHTQFVSLQRSIEDFIEVRELMSFVNPDSDDDASEELPLEDHGIQAYFETLRRGNYFIPPRDLRSLPPADPA